MSKSLSKSRFIELFSESPKARLADTCKLINGDRGKNYPSSNDRVESGIPFINAGNLNGKNIDFSGMEYITEEKYSTLKTGKVQKGDILYCLRGSLGKIGLVDFDEGLIASSLVIIRCDQNKLLPDFLLCALGSNEVKQQLLKANNGSSQPNLSAASVKEYKVTCPSINEQKEFSEFIKQIDKSKFILQKMIEKLELLKKSRFIELFGNPTINEKGFPLLTVDDVIKFEGGSQPNKAFFEYEKTENNIRLIQIRDYKTDEYITYIPKDMAKRLCSADDIMIGRYGPPIFQILQGIEGAYNVALMKAIPKKGNKDFIRSWLKQDCLLKYLEALSGRTAGQDGIQMDKLKAYPFPYPPIELQDQWVKIDKQIDKSKLILQKQLDDLVGETK